MRGEFRHPVYFTSDSWTRHLHSPPQWDLEALNFFPGISFAFHALRRRFPFLFTPAKEFLPQAPWFRFTSGVWGEYPHIISAVQIPALTAFQPPISACHICYVHVPNSQPSPCFHPIYLPRQQTDSRFFPLGRELYLHHHFGLPPVSTSTTLQAVSLAFSRPFTLKGSIKRSIYLYLQWRYLLSVLLGCLRPHGFPIQAIFALNYISDNQRKITFTPRLGSQPLVPPLELLVITTHTTGALFPVGLFSLETFFIPFRRREDM